MKNNLYYFLMIVLSILFSHCKEHKPRPKIGKNELYVHYMTSGGGASYPTSFEYFIMANEDIKSDSEYIDLARGYIDTAKYNIPINGMIFLSNIDDFTTNFQYQDWPIIRKSYKIEFYFGVLNDNRKGKITAIYHWEDGHRCNPRTCLNGTHKTFILGR
jgi:hypothetical protein